MPRTVLACWSRIPRLALALAAAALLAARGGTALAQNLLTNPHFDTGLSGWQVLGSTTWDGTLDAGGHAPASGSARAVVHQPGIAAVVTQCVPLTIGTTYHFGGKVFIPAGNAASGGAFYFLILFPQADCQGPPPPGGGVLQTGDVTTTGAWIDSETTFTDSFARSALVQASVAPDTAGSFQANFDDVVVAEGALPCAPDVSGSLCLLDGRFTVSAGFVDPSGGPGLATAVPLGDGNNSGYYWFFGPNNVEVLVKLIDGCTVNGHFWFFAAGLTNLDVVLLVDDGSTGQTKRYENPANTAFAPIQDTSAFSCP